MNSPFILGKGAWIIFTCSWNQLLSGCSFDTSRPIHSVQKLPNQKQTFIPPIPISLCILEDAWTQWPVMCFKGSICCENFITKVVHNGNMIKLRSLIHVSKTWIIEIDKKINGNLSVRKMKPNTLKEIQNNYPDVISCSFAPLPRGGHFHQTSWVY